MNRENGFYWVRDDTGWTIDEYQDGLWIGYNLRVNDTFYNEIDERKIVREQPLNNDKT